MVNAIDVCIRCFEKDPSKGAEARIQQHGAWVLETDAPVVANDEDVHVIVDVIDTEECIRDATNEFVGEG